MEKAKVDESVSRETRGVVGLDILPRGEGNLKVSLPEQEEGGMQSALSCASSLFDGFVSRS